MHDLTFRATYKLSFVSRNMQPLILRHLSIALSVSWATRSLNDRPDTLSCGTIALSFMLPRRSCKIRGVVMLSVNSLGSTSQSAASWHILCPESSISIIIHDPRSPNPPKTTKHNLRVLSQSAIMHSRTLRIAALCSAAIDLVVSQGEPFNFCRDNTCESIPPKPSGPWTFSGRMPLTLELLEGQC